MAILPNDPSSGLPLDGVLTQLAVTGRNWVQPSYATITGGDWLNPLNNLKDPRPSIYIEARYPTNADTTQFYVDFGNQRAVEVVWFVGLQTSIHATMDIHLSNLANFSDSSPIGYFSCWPTDHQSSGTDPWGWYTGTGAINAQTHYAQNLTRIIKIPDTHPNRTARYMWIRIVDPDGYPPVRVGCVGASEVARWEFKYNWQMTFLDESVNTIALSGTTYTDVRRKKRRLNIGFFPIMEEFFHGKNGRFYDWLAYKGQSEPFVIMPFFSDAYANVTIDPYNRLEKLGFYGMRSTAPSFTNPYRTYYDLNLQVDEL